MVPWLCLPTGTQLPNGLAEPRSLCHPVLRHNAPLPLTRVKGWQREAVTSCHCTVPCRFCILYIDVGFCSVGVLFFKGTGPFLDRVREWLLPPNHKAVVTARSSFKACTTENHVSVISSILMYQQAREHHGAKESNFVLFIRSSAVCQVRRCWCGHGSDNLCAATLRKEKASWADSYLLRTHKTYCMSRSDLPWAL